SAGETGEDLSLIEPSYLAGGPLDDGLPEAHLPVAGDHHVAAMAHAEDRRAVHSRLTSLGGGRHRRPSSDDRGSRVCSVESWRGSSGREALGLRGDPLPG